MAAIDSSAILALVKNSTSSMNRGRAMNLQQTARRPSSGATRRQQDFLDQMATLDYPQTVGYAHPADNALMESGLNGRDDGPLTPTEHAWLARLSDNPTQVNDSDAATLAALAQKVSAMRHPMDSKLVDTYWAPVKAVHDQKRDDANAANAAQRLPAIPSGAAGALADAIAAENPTLTADEAMGRARDQLDTALSARDASRARRVGAAR